MQTNWVMNHRGLLRVAAVVVALVVCLVGYGIGDSVTSIAPLVLVLVVVAAAATGDRWSGVLAALVGAAGFDFFLAPPLLSFTIFSAHNIVLAVVLLIVGLAVSELSLWGGRQKSIASERQGYLDGALAITDLTASGASRQHTADAVSTQMQRVLGVEKVTYVAGRPDAASAVLDREGNLTVGGQSLDVKADGLPTDRFIAIPVTQADGSAGHFRISAAASLVRVRPEQLRVAVLLADEFSASERDRAQNA